MVDKRKRKKYGLRKGCLKDVFSNIGQGEMRTFSMDDYLERSVRQRAVELNREADYIKYSVSIDRLTNTIRVINND